MPDEVVPVDAAAEQQAIALYLRQMEAYRVAMVGGQLNQGDILGAFERYMAEKAEKKDKTKEAPKLDKTVFKCERCLLVTDLPNRAWAEGKMSLCRGCYKILAACGYCGTVLPSDKFSLGTATSVNCTVCGTGGKPLLTVKQTGRWKPQSNVVKERSNTLWTTGI